MVTSAPLPRPPCCQGDWGTVGVRGYVTPSSLSPRQGSQPYSPSFPGASLEAALMAGTPVQDQAGWGERGQGLWGSIWMLLSLPSSLPWSGIDKNTSGEQAITVFQVGPPRLEVPRQRAGE